MDLAGFAVYGRVGLLLGQGESATVLRAMDFRTLRLVRFAPRLARPETTEAEVLAFAEAWGAAHDRFARRGRRGHQRCAIPHH